MQSAAFFRLVARQKPVVDFALYQRREDRNCPVWSIRKGLVEEQAQVFCEADELISVHYAL